MISASALIILICIGALSFWSEVRNDRDRESVMHTYLVVERLQASLQGRGDLVDGYKLGVNAYAQKPETVRQDGMFWMVINQALPPEPLKPPKLAELRTNGWVRCSVA